MRKVRAFQVLSEVTQVRNPGVFPEKVLERFTETVVGLLKDSEALANMKSCNLNIAREKYNVDVMVERFLKITKMAVDA